MVDTSAFDLKTELGARDNFSVQRIAIYLPNKDRDGNPVKNIEAYIASGMRLLAEINLGVTRLPWANGIWINTEKGAQSIPENTTVIYSFLRKPVEFFSRISDIKAFIHTFGKETNQGEVFVEYCGELEETFYWRAYAVADYED